MRSLVADITSLASGNSVAETASAAREDVASHLRRLFGVARGSVLLAPDYGTEDAAYIFHLYPGSVPHAVNQLLLLIRQYEPRLVNARVVQVAPDVREWSLRFELEGSLLTDERSFPVRFSCALGSDGGIDVR